MDLVDGFQLFSSLTSYHGVPYRVVDDFQYCQGRSCCCCKDSDSCYGQGFETVHVLQLEGLLSVRSRPLAWGYRGQGQGSVVVAAVLCRLLLLYR